MTVPFPLDPALWVKTAAPPPATVPLAAPASVDVAIVGGGYAGLSTALHLAERGIRALVLEAREIGFGASGRNGGQVIPGLKYDPDELVQRFGSERGERLAAFGGSAAGLVFDLIDRHRMEVPRVHGGWIQAADRAEDLALAESRVAQWSRRGAPVRLLDRAGIASRLGSDHYLGGWEDARAGGIQPLAYARGLAKAALAAGVPVHTDTAVTRLARHGSGWRLETATGHAVTAERVVLATNAYSSGLWPGLAQTLIPMQSFQVATAPLSDDLRRSVLPQGHVVSNARKLLLYFRLDHEGRLLLGGRGPLREPRGPGDWAHIERVVPGLFPALAGIGIEHRWCGRLAVTRDYLPHLHEPAPGLLIDVGCQGRGVALQTAMGKAMAAHLAGEPDALPLPPVPLTPFPLHGLHRLYVSAAIAWYRLTDGGL